MNYAPTSTRSLLAYASPSTPLNILMLQLVVYIPTFYAQEIGLDLATVGLVFILARSWDAIIDPLIGNLSDRTRSRWGRRKPWILVGMPLLTVATIAFCLPPEGVGIGYLAIVAFVFYVALTIVQIPYLSWGAELSRDYTERTRIGVYREGGLMVGIVIAAALPLVFFSSGDPSLRDILSVFVAATVILLPATVLVALRVTPSAPFIDTGPSKFFPAIWALRVNKPLLRLLAGILCFWLGGSLFNALVLLMVQFTLSLPTSGFLWFLFAQYVIAIAFLPLAARIASRIGRHRALILGGLGFFFLLPLFMLVAPGNFWQAMIIFCLSGTLTSFIWIIPPAMVADTVEYGMLKGCSDDAALYMALYMFTQKFALAVGGGVALVLAGVLGFDPTNPDSPLFGLNLTALVLPSVMGIVGAIIMFNYPIDARTHGVIRRWLARRKLTTTI